jgi:hypothetical protein
VSCADVCLSHDHDCDSAFSVTKYPTARKPHKCCECRAVIPSGAKYQRCTGKWDGVFGSETTCMVCCEIREAFVCGSWVFGMLWESMREEMFPMWRTKGAWDCLAKLTTTEAVAKCNAKYKEWYGDRYDDEQEPTPTPEGQGDE